MDGAAFNINDQILEGLRPNFFELLSEEAMHGALRPAFQYVAKVSSYIPKAVVQCSIDE